MTRGKPDRYTLYRYAANHYAIDCEPCNRKIANLKSDSDPGKILVLLAYHDKHHHDDEPPEAQP